MAVKEKSVLEQMFPREGDIKVEWDKDNVEETNIAEQTFNTMKNEKNYIAFKARADGSQGEQIREFDPDAERILMSPQPRGG